MYETEKRIMKCFDFMMVRTENTTVRVIEVNISLLQINSENMRCILFDRSMKFYHLLSNITL